MAAYDAAAVIRREHWDSVFAGLEDSWPPCPIGGDETTVAGARREADRVACMFAYADADRREGARRSAAREARDRGIVAAATSNEGYLSCQFALERAIRDAGYVDTDTFSFLDPLFASSDLDAPRRIGAGHYRLRGNGTARGRTVFGTWVSLPRYWCDITGGLDGSITYSAVVAGR